MGWQNAAERGLVLGKGFIFLAAHPTQKSTDFLCSNITVTANVTVSRTNNNNNNDNDNDNDNDNKPHI